MSYRFPINSYSPNFFPTSSVVLHIPPPASSEGGRLGFGDSLPSFLRHQSFFTRCGPAKLYRPPDGGVESKESFF